MNEWMNRDKLLIYLEMEEEGYCLVLWVEDVQYSVGINKFVL